MQAGDSPSELKRELGVKRELLYEWKKRVEEGGPENLRGGAPAGGRPRRRPAGAALPATHRRAGTTGWQAVSTDPFFRERLRASRCRDDWEGGVYEAIRQEREREGSILTVEAMCRETGVSRSGFYRHWHQREPSTEETELRERLQQLALAQRTYGYRRIAALPRREGRLVNHKRVLRLLREDNLLALRKNRFVTTIDGRHRWRVWPNLARRIQPHGPNQQ